MQTITFYRQKRIDGGIRTGVEVGGNTVLSTFKSGRGEHDPALVWYVDVICKGRKLPKNSEEARRWLVDHHASIQRLLNALAGRIMEGIDPDVWPISQQGIIHGVKIRISCSTVRRLEARKLATVIRDIAQRWDEYVGDLAPV
ncbi:MAG: hypothetical protein ABSC42_02155 [Tepidisphaeraceae bacterium]